jgi:hypothetical protein
MAGGTYKISFAVQVAAGLKEQAVLRTSTLSFDAVPGTVQLVLEGSVPSDFVSETLSTGQTLHAAKQMAVLELAMESGAVVSDLKLEVIDGTIEEFRSVLNAKKQLLANMDADPAYVSLARAVVSSAEAQATVGYTDLATETLKAVPSSGWLKPQASTSYQWIIIGILAALTVLFAFLLARARTETGFIKRQTDGQAKRLQLLAMKASRIGDSTLTEGIEQVRKELQQSAGGS